MLAIWAYFWDWPTEWVAPEIGVIVVCGSEADALVPVGAVAGPVLAVGSRMSHSPIAGRAATLLARASAGAAPMGAKSQTIGLTPRASVASTRAIGSVAAVLRTVGSASEVGLSIATPVADARAPASQEDLPDVRTGQIERIELC